MRWYPISLMATLFLCLTLQAQEQNRYTLFLRSGAFIPPSDLSSQHLAQFGPSAKRLAGKQSFLIQFRQLPTQETRIRLQRSGIELQDYIPNNAFLATATGTLDSALLQALDVRAVLPLLPQQKIQPELANGFVPPHAIPAVGSVDLWVQLFPSFGYAESVQQLRQLNVQVLHELFRGYDIVAVRLNAARLNELADLPYVQYLQPIPGPDQELNNRSIGLSRANVLRSSLSGQRNLRGSGVVVGVGDNANPMNHVDFTGRLINRSGAASGSHGLHVSGTVLGGGIIDERTEGYAPKATLIKQYFSGILINTPAYIQDYGMVITNNSYGNIVECASFGTYTLY
ncbi:MAG: hypothetical protein RJA57_2042, partial [Bacteroidota bacterium]